MNKARLTWEEIVEKYPFQCVGLIDVEFDTDGVSPISGIVAYTEDEISRDEMALMAVRKEIVMIMTGLRELTL